MLKFTSFLDNKDDLYATKEEVIKACKNGTLLNLIERKIISEDLLIFLCKNKNSLLSHYISDNLLFGNIISNQLISENFIEEYILNSYCGNIFPNLIYYQNLSENFIRKYKRYFEFSRVLTNQKLSESFIIDILNELYQKKELLLNKSSDFFKLDDCSTRHDYSFSKLEYYISYYISHYQNVTKNISDKFNIVRSTNNLKGLESNDIKAKLMSMSSKFEFFDDYIIGYSDCNFNKYNLKYKYSIGSKIISKSPINLNLFTYDEIAAVTKNRKPSYQYLMVKVNYKDIQDVYFRFSNALIIGQVNVIN